MKRSSIFEGTIDPDSREEILGTLKTPTIKQMKNMSKQDLELLEKYYHDVLEALCGDKVWVILENLEHINHFIREKN